LIQLRLGQIKRRQALLPAVRSADESVAKVVKDGIPTLLVRLCHVIIRKTGMQESHESPFSLFPECHRDHRFLSQGIP
jgi:hypothetical protein